MRAEKCNRWKVIKVIKILSRKRMSIFIWLGHSQ